MVGTLTPLRRTSNVPAPVGQTAGALIPGGIDVVLSALIDLELESYGAWVIRRLKS